MKHYKNQKEKVNSQNRLKKVSDIYHEEYEKNRLKNEEEEENNDFSLDHYLKVLVAVVDGGDKDEIYDCLDELIGHLNGCDFIEPLDQSNSQKLLVFNLLIDDEDLDIKNLSCQCISLLISKCFEIGYFLYQYNIIDIIAQKIQDNQNPSLFYQLFDIVRSLSLLDQNILNSIIECFPVSLWTQFLNIDAIYDKFTEFLISITRNENEDLEFQKNTLSIFSTIIENGKKEMFKPIAISLDQMLNYSSFNFDLFFEMDFHQFILKLLYSINSELVSLSLHLISKSIHALFFIDQKSIDKILYYSKQKNDIRIKCSSLECLSSIIKVNHEISTEFILKEDFLIEIINYYKMSDFDYQVKINLTNFLLDCLLFSDFQLCFTLIFNYDLFDSFSFLLNSDDQFILDKFLNVIWRMKDLFECNKVLYDLEIKLNEEFPLDSFLIIRDIIEDEALLVLFDQIIEKFYNETY